MPRTSDVLSLGWTPYSRISTADDNATVLKATRGRLGWITASNVNAAVRFLKIYDKATTPLSSDTPVMRIALPGGAAGTVSIPNMSEQGVQFTNGIGIRIVTLVADNDTTAPAATEILVNIGYL